MTCGRKIGPYIDFETRFWAHVPLRGNGCWNWYGAHGSHGYGIIMRGRKALLAHRVAYELLRGPIPTGLHIDHLCHNRGCVNPRHLEAVTQRENNRRSKTASTIHAEKQCCPKCGGPYTKMNTGERRCIPCRLARRRDRYAMGCRNV